MGTISTGKFSGSDSSFKARKSKGVSAGLKLGAQRKDSLEKKAVNDKQDQEQAKTKEISRREEERATMRKELKNRVSEESNPNRNTDERRKVVNVGRPDTAKNPMDVRSKLAKQTEIKTKIIDENEVRSMSLQKYHNLSDDLVAAVRGVLEGKNPFAKDDKSPKKDDDDKDDDKKSKSKKDDDDDDSDDDKNKKVGKDGKKTKVDISPPLKNANEEVEQIDELSNKTLRSYSVGASRHLMDIKPAWIRPGDYEKGAAVGAHGKTAKKRAQGLETAGKKIAKNIATKNASVKEEVTLSDEETARILAKLNEEDDEKHEDGPEHIVMQLRKAKSLGANNRPIHFHDGSKVKVHPAHVQKALDKHGSFKKAPEKDDFTKKLQASHSSFKKAIGEE